eukprot:750942-Hanusia_phi.AAC.9
MYNNDISNSIAMFYWNDKLCDSLAAACSTSGIDGVVRWESVRFECGSCTASVSQKLKFEVTRSDRSQIYVETDTFLVLMSQVNTINSNFDQVDCFGGKVWSTQPTFELVNTDNNLLTPFNGGSVAVDLVSRPSGCESARLLGTSSVIFYNGVASFTDLAVDQQCISAYIVQFSFSVGSISTSAGLSLTKDISVQVSTGDPYSLKIITFSHSGSDFFAGSPFTLSTQVYDMGGNPVTSFTNNPTVQVNIDEDFLSNENLVLQGQSCFVSCSLVFSQGFFSSDTLRINEAPSFFRLAISTSFPSNAFLIPTIYTDYLQLKVGSPAELRLVNHPQDAVSGDVLQEIVLMVLDAGGNHLVSDSQLIVRVTVSSGSGSLSGFLNATSSVGVISFSEVIITLPDDVCGNVLQAHILKFTVDSGEFSTNSLPFVITFAPSASDFLVNPPLYVGCGMPWFPQPAIAVLDKCGFMVRSNKHVADVSASVQDNVLGCHLLHDVTWKTYQGAATLSDVTLISQAGPCNVSFSVVTSDFSLSLFKQIYVYQGNPAKLEVDIYHEPSSTFVLSGLPIPHQPKLYLKDAGNNVIGLNASQLLTAVLLSNNELSLANGSQALLGTTTINIQQGIALFTNLRVNQVGNFSLRFWFNGTIKVDSLPFQVSVGPIAQIVFSAQPASAIFSELMDPPLKLLLLDRGGNPVGGTPWVKLSSSPYSLSCGDCDASGCYGYAANNDGVVTFTGCKIVTGQPGDLLVRAELAEPSIFGQAFAVTSSVIKVTGLPSRMQLVHDLPLFVAVPTSSFALLPLQPQVQVLDLSSASVAWNEGSVTVSIIKHNVNDTLRLLGTLSVGLLQGIATFTDIGTTGQGSNVSLLFDYNLSSSRAFIAPLLLTNFSFISSFPDSLRISDFESNFTVGVMKNFSVQGEDSSGSAVSLANKDFQFDLQVQNCSACVTFGGFLVTSQLATVANVMIRKSGTWNMTFVISWNGKAVEQTIGPLQIFPGQIDKIVVRNQPSNSTVSVVIEPYPQLSLSDAYGNDVQCTKAYDYSQSILNVNLSSLSVRYFRLNGTLSLKLTCESSQLTLRDLSVNTTGSDFFLVFSIHSDMKVVTAISDLFAVRGRAVDFLPLFSDVNLVWKAGNNHTLEFVAIDSNLHVSYSQNTSMRAYLESDSTFLYTLQEINSSANFAFHNLSVQEVGNFNLSFAILFRGQLSNTKSLLLTVIPGEAQQMIIEQSPSISDNQAGVIFSWQPILTVRYNLSEKHPLTTSLSQVLDAHGNKITATLTVTVSLDAGAAQYPTSSGLEYNPLLPTLTGNRARTATGRIAFTDLAVNKAGIAYKLFFSSPGLPSASSPLFNVSVGSPDHLKVSRQAFFLVANRPAQFLITTHDKGGNFVPSNISFTISASLALSAFQSSSSIIGGDLKQNIHDGRALFDNIIFKVAGPFFRLVFSCEGLTSDTSRAFAVISSFSSAACSSTNDNTQCGLPEENAMSLVFSSAVQTMVANESFDISSNLTFIDTIGRSQSPDCSDMFYSVRKGGLVVDAQSHSLGSCSPSDGRYPCNSLRILHSGTYKVQFTLSCSGVLYQSPTLNFTVLPQVPCCLQYQTPPPSRVVQHATFSSQFYLTDSFGNSVNRSIVVHADVVDVLANSRSFTLSSQIMQSGLLTFEGTSFSSPGVYRMSFVSSDPDVTAATAAVTIEVYASSVPASISFSASPTTAIAKYASQDLSNKKNFYFNSLPRLLLKDSLGNTLNLFKGVVRLFLNSSNTNFRLTGDISLLFFLPWQDLGGVNLQAARSSLSVTSVSLIASAHACQTCNKLFDVESNQIYVSDYVSQVDLSLPRSLFPAGDPIEVATSIKDATGKVFCGGVTLVQLVYTNTIGSTNVAAVQNFNFSGLKSNQACEQTSLSLDVQKSVGAFPVKVFVCLQGMFEPCFSSNSLLLNISLGRPVSFLLVRSPDQAGSINFGGSSFQPQPVLQAVDFAGNAVSLLQASTTRAALISGSGGQLLGNVNCTCGTNGTCAFTNLAIDRAGMGFRISFYSSLFNTSTVSQPFNVVVGPPSRVRLLQPPLNNAAGEPLLVQPLAAVTDAGGNWVSGASPVVEVGFCCQCDVLPTNCSLRGNRLISAVNGVADFTDLIIARTGTNIPILFRLLPVAASCSSVRFPLDCSSSCCSSAGSITITEGPPASLVLQAQPAPSQRADVVFSAQPAVQLEDAGGNAVLNSNRFTVTVALFAGSTQMELTGGTALVAALGRVVFTDLKTTKEGSRFVLVFRVYQEGVALNISASTSPFGVSTGQAASLQFAGNFSKRPAGTALSTFPQVQLVDAGGNPIVTSSANISFWLQSSCQQTLLVGDLQQSSSVAYTWTSSITAPCAANRLVASISAYPFVALSPSFAIDVGGPANLVVERTTSDQVVVRWQNPPTGPAPSSYLIRYSPFAFPNGTEVFTASMTISSQTTIATLTGLNPLVLYNISICSISLYTSRSDCSSDSLSLFSAPIADAVNLTVEHVDEMSALISWFSPSQGVQPPSYRIIQRCVDNRTCGDSYNIAIPAFTFDASLSSYVNQDKLGSSSPGTQLSYLITNLTSGLGYVFQVRSKFAAPGNLFSPSGPVTQTVYPTATANPLSFKVTCLPPCSNPPSMQVSWAAATGETSRVVVDYLGLLAPSVTSPVTSLGQFNFSNNSLVRGASLLLQLYTQNLASNLFMPVARKFYRLVSRPAPPASLSVSIINNEVFFVSWLPSRDVGDGTSDGVAVTGYSVVCRRADETVLFQTSVGKEVLNVSISSLLRGETYHISVSVRTQKNAMEGGEQFTSELLSVDQYLGFVPVLAPSSFDPSITYDAFIGVLFSKNLTAQDADANQTLEVMMDNSEVCLGSLNFLHGPNPVLYRYDFLPKVSDSGKIITSCFRARDSQGLTSSRVCVVLRVASPSPSFQPLSGTMPVSRSLPFYVKGEYQATAGCRLAISLVGSDGTSAGIATADASSLGYNLRMEHQITIITSATGGSTSIGGLPPGAEFLGSNTEWANPVERSLLWRPARGQDSLVYDFCFILTDSSGISTTGGFGLKGGSDFCLRVSVSRCKYCIQVTVLPLTRRSCDDLLTAGGRVPVRHIARVEDNLAQPVERQRGSPPPFASRRRHRASTGTSVRGLGERLAAVAVCQVHGYHRRACLLES